MMVWVLIILIAVAAAFGLVLFVDGLMRSDDD